MIWEISPYFWKHPIHKLWAYFGWIPRAQICPKKRPRKDNRIPFLIATSLGTVSLIITLVLCIRHSHELLGCFQTAGRKWQGILLWRFGHRLFGKWMPQFSRVSLESNGTCSVDCLLAEQVLKPSSSHSSASSTCSMKDHSSLGVHDPLRCPIYMFSLAPPQPHAED